MSDSGSKVQPKRNGLYSNAGVDITATAVVGDKVTVYRDSMNGRTPIYGVLRSKNPQIVAGSSPPPGAVRSS
jgi:hypothetical protein